MQFLTHKASCKEDMRFPYFLSVSKLIYRRADGVILTLKTFNRVDTNENCINQRCCG